LLLPGGMDTAFFHGRDEQYKPGPDAKLNRPADVAAVGDDRIAAAAGLRAAGDPGGAVGGGVLAVSMPTVETLQ